MRQRAVPPGTGRCQKGAALAVFIPLPELAVCHTQYSSSKNAKKAWFQVESNPRLV